jgi:hypothetical protein
VPLVVQPRAGFVQELIKLSIQPRLSAGGLFRQFRTLARHFAARRNGAPYVDQIQYNAIM